MTASSWGWIPGVELDPLAVTPSREMRKPFDVLVEGLLSENSRGSRI
jgi:hypothetical protein